MAHRAFALILALLLAAGALPAKAGADAPCVPVTAEIVVPAPATFVLPPHTLATLRWADRWSAEIFRVPATVQVTVISGYGSFRSYSLANCTESQLEWTARDEAWRTGRAVGDIYSMPTRLQVTAIGYYPTPTPYVPVPSQPAPGTPAPYYPVQPAPIAFPQPLQPCGPAHYTVVSPDPGRVYGAAVIRVEFESYSFRVVRPILGDQTAFIRDAKTIEVWELPGCDGSVVGAVATGWVAQGGSVSYDNAPSALQGRMSLVRRP